MVADDVFVKLLWFFWKWGIGYPDLKTVKREVLLGH